MPGLGLTVRPDHARVGDHVLVAPTGSDADRSLGGVASMLQAERDGDWVDLFYLVCRWGQNAPTCIPAHEPAWFPRIGLKGPVAVAVPPIEPGRYRIRRHFAVLRRDERPAGRTTHADLVVEA
jgi:hypothetical protein